MSPTRPTNNSHLKDVKLFKFCLLEHIYTIQCLNFLYQFKYSSYRREMAIDSGSEKSQHQNSQQTPAPGDEEQHSQERDKSRKSESAFKNLGWLDRLLALWIFLAMLIGILLGNFVRDVRFALHKGDLVGVSVPIGESSLFAL